MTLTEKLELIGWIVAIIIFLQICKGEIGLCW